MNAESLRSPAPLLEYLVSPHISASFIRFAFSHLFLPRLHVFCLTGWSIGHPKHRVVNHNALVTCFVAPSTTLFPTSRNPLPWVFIGVNPTCLSRDLLYWLMETLDPASTSSRIPSARCHHQLPSLVQVPHAYKVDGPLGLDIFQTLRVCIRARKRLLRDASRGSKVDLWVRNV